MAAKGRELPAEIERRMTAARERARRHDARGWRDELKRWYDLFDKLGLGFPSLGFRLEPISMAGRIRLVIRHGAVARLIGPDASRRTLPRSLLPALIVTLDAPDDVLRAAFEAELRKAREQYPFPVMKQGKKSKISHKPWPDIFLRWINHDVLPLAEFLAWRSGFGSQGKDDYPDVTFARWRDKGKETTAVTMASLFRAIKSLPKLDREVATSSDDFSDDDRKLLVELTADFEAAERAKAHDPDG